VVGAAHTGKVNAVFCLHDHNVLITGGDDGYVAFWKASDVTPLHKAGQRRLTLIETYVESAWVSA
jgi:WD40 repeat protein